jgi:hypothetical protein
MPRSGPPSYTYTLPPVYLAIPGTTIITTQHNDPLEDIAATFNSAQPVVWGGTGATTEAGARSNLGAMAETPSLTALSTAFTPASASGAASLALAEDTDNGSHKVSIAAPASVASDKIMTLPDATDTFAGLTATQTFTNKRITERVTSITSSATPTVNTDNTDFVNITALAAAITSMTTNLSGTPTIGQALIYQILDNGSARAIAWGASFTAKGTALPTTTVASKLLTVAFLWNGSTWGCVGSQQEA